MTENAVVRARIDPKIKDEATTGLTVSDAFRMMLVCIVAERQQARVLLANSVSAR